MVLLVRLRFTSATPRTTYLTFIHSRRRPLSALNDQLAALSSCLVAWRVGGGGLYYPSNQQSNVQTAATGRC